MKYKNIIAVLTALPLFGLAAYGAGEAKPAFPAGSTSRDIGPKMPAPPAAFAWAYPVAPPNLPKPNPKALHTAAGADPSMKLTMAKIGDAFGPPDWFPKEHAPLPAIAAHGRKPHVMACILCHLPNGNGHPESASVSGLTEQYIIEQMHAFRDGDRRNNRAPAMIEMSLAITEAELRQAAQYFARIPRGQQKWIRVVETARAPANHVGEGGMRFFDKGTQTVPMSPDMIYEVAENEEPALRNDHVGFVDYVPVGALAKGRIVAMGKRGAFRTCGSCHGDDFRGHEDAPRLAGRGAYYLIRQLADDRSGARKGDGPAKMKDVVSKLTDADILNVAAFMASQKP